MDVCRIYIKQGYKACVARSKKTSTVIKDCTDWLQTGSLCKWILRLSYKRYLFKEI